MPPFDESLVYSPHDCLPLASSGAYPNSNEYPITSSKYATSNRSHLAARRNRAAARPSSYWLFQTFETGISISPPPSATSSLEEVAVSVVQSQLDTIDASNIHFQSGFSEGPSTFLYVRQSHEGVPFANAVANIALHNNKIVAFGSPETITPSTPSFDVGSVIPRAEKVLNGKFNGHATLEYLVEGKFGSRIRLTHVVQIQNDNKGTWFEAYMDAHSGYLIAATDFVASASYKVVPIRESGLGHSSGWQTILPDPQDTFSSPFGWHNNGTATTTSTDGNNVIAFKRKVNFWTRKTEAVTTPETGAGLVFNYTYMDSRGSKIGKTNLDAACTNAFYVINTMHDIAYKYGFTEKSFNFQTNNFGKDGLGNDRIEVQVHADPHGYSSSFHTPPEYLVVCGLTITLIILIVDNQESANLFRRVLRSKFSDWRYRRRDMAMHNGIIVHEFTHGITRRMVGGGSARCFDTEESKGLGEGFSDAMAEWVQQKPIPPGSPLPNYAFGHGLRPGVAGLRVYPYSILEDTNPLRYSTISDIGDVHRIGEVWANMLHNVYAVLVEEHGFSENARTDPTTFEGNVIFMHLFIDALSLLPCNPTFLHARDAWIQADRNRRLPAEVWESGPGRGAVPTPKAQTCHLIAMYMTEPNTPNQAPGFTRYVAQESRGLLEERTPVCDVPSPLDTSILVDMLAS
ncbi:Fungalysin metallopeptidase-domain-containing protein [Infundibulicybe gibba]|nr:Fungalysin metallopeptidase-domain-containing protein [Infundibulicybe gibba]